MPTSRCDRPGSEETSTSGRKTSLSDPTEPAQAGMHSSWTQESVKGGTRRGTQTGSVQMTLGKRQKCPQAWAELRGKRWRGGSERGMARRISNANKNEEVSGSGGGSKRFTMVEKKCLLPCRVQSFPFSPRGPRWRQAPSQDEQPSIRQQDQSRSLGKCCPPCPKSSPSPR